MPELRIKKLNVEVWDKDRGANPDDKMGSVFLNINMIADIRRQWFRFGMLLLAHVGLICNYTLAQRSADVSGSVYHALKFREWVDLPK